MVPTAMPCKQPFILWTAKLMNATSAEIPVYRTHHDGSKFDAIVESRSASGAGVIQLPICSLHCTVLAGRKNHNAIKRF